MATTETAILQTEYPHVVRRPGVVGGSPHVEGTRLAVWLLASLVQQGADVAELLEMYPQLTPAAAHSALAYAWDHKTEVDAEVEANRPETVTAAMRRDARWVEVTSGRFQVRPPAASDTP
jgi:uncharacterized protein (DUF433 family)